MATLTRRAALWVAAATATLTAAETAPASASTLRYRLGTYPVDAVVKPVNGVWPSRPTSSTRRAYIFAGPIDIDPPPPVASGTAGMQPQDICIRG